MYILGVPIRETAFSVPYIALQPGGHCESGTVLKGLSSPSTITTQMICFLLVRYQNKLWYVLMNNIGMVWLSVFHYFLCNFIE